MPCRPCPLLFALILTCAGFAPAGTPDWAAIAGGYPRLGTLQAQEEAAIMLWLQNIRTRADLARVELENHPDLACFLAALGSSWGGSAYPATKAMLKQAKEDLKPMVAGLKASFARPRPHVTDPALAPALPWRPPCPTTAASPSPASMPPWAPCTRPCSSRWIPPTRPRWTRRAS